jgi:hypothetical protein
MTPSQPQQPPQQTGGLQPVQSDVVRIVAPPAPAYMPHFNDQQLADLTAAIALYPDPLLSEMLPSATYVQELAYADRWLEQHPGADERLIADLPLNPSVKTMMHYPSVLNIMTDHLDWTQTLGAAFIYQRTDLMESVQRWRRTAVAYGTLVSTPQQDVLQQGPIIMIVPPPRQQVVYVPVYDPAVVYVRPVRPARDYITFSAGGFSLSFVQNDLDWHDHQVRVPIHHDDWDGRSGGDGRGGSGRGGDGRSGDGRGGDGRGGERGGSGRGGSSSPKAIFTRDDFKPVIPTKVITPQPDKKVVTIPSTQGRGTSTNPAPARGNSASSGRSGGSDNNPATPW